MTGFVEFELLDGGRIAIDVSTVCAVSTEDGGSSIFFGDARVVSVKVPMDAALARVAHARFDLEQERV